MWLGTPHSPTPDVGMFINEVPVFLPCALFKFLFTFGLFVSSAAVAWIKAFRGMYSCQPEVLMLR